MFGILYVVYSAAIQLIGSVGYEIQNSVSKRRSIDPETGISIDMKGRTYDYTLGGRQVHINSKNMGRYLVEDFHGNVLSACGGAAPGSARPARPQ